MPTLQHTQPTSKWRAFVHWLKATEGWQQGRAEKRLYRAFRRASGIRRITPAKKPPAHLPYAGYLMPSMRRQSASIAHDGETGPLIEAGTAPGARHITKVEWIGHDQPDSLAANQQNWSKAA